jgi:hypothetical protein
LFSVAVKHPREFRDLCERLVGHEVRDVSQIATYHQEIFRFGERCFRDIEEASVLKAGKAFRDPSAMFVGTDRADRRTCEVKPYRSFRGKPVVIL